jgi:hypothetical protein
VLTAAPGSRSRRRTADVLPRRWWPGLVADPLGWSARRTHAEVVAFHARLDKERAVVTAAGDPTWLRARTPRPAAAAGVPGNERSIRPRKEASR